MKLVPHKKVKFVYLQIMKYFIYLYTLLLLIAQKSEFSEWWI